MDLPEFITESADGALTVKLSRGLDVDGATIKSLTLREPNVGDQMDAPGRNDSEKEVALIANLCGQTPTDIRSLKLRDYSRVQAALAFFYG
jgi:phage FluMu protein gp41